MNYFKHVVTLHLAFFEFYGNPHLLKTYKNFRQQYYICSNKIANTDSIESFEEHRKLIKALKERDKKLALTALRDHIEKAKQRIIDGFIRVDS